MESTKEKFGQTCKPAPPKGDITPARDTTPACDITPARDVTPARDGKTAAHRRGRLNSIDLLRGIIMVIMLLDHTRDFMHRDVLNFEATDLSRTNILLFLTRWITHFCAPIFVFLAGTSVFLQSSRKTKPELSSFLIKRGLWLILLELTIIRLIVWFNIDYHFALQLQVIWVIGVGMIALAGLIYLPLRVTAVLSIAIIGLHHLVDAIRVAPPGRPGGSSLGIAFIWMVLHQPGLLNFGSGFFAMILYPLIPWVAVLWAGYAFGQVYQLSDEKRRSLLVKLGSGVLVLFVVVRAINVYGNPLPWEVQKNIAFTILSFVNVNKYPPSLLFVLMTIGVAILALPWFERHEKGWLAEVMITFGRVPLFFYFGQWIAVHLIATVAGLLAGQPVGWLFDTPLARPSPNPGNLGYSLATVYLFWVLGIFLLYPACRWFAEVKRRRNDWWLSYL